MDDDSPRTPPPPYSEANDAPPALRQELLQQAAAEHGRGRNDDVAPANAQQLNGRVTRTRDAGLRQNTDPFGAGASSLIHSGRSSSKLCFSLEPNEDFTVFDVIMKAKKMFLAKKEGATWRVFDPAEKVLCEIVMNDQTTQGYTGLKGLICDGAGKQIGCITHEEVVNTRGRLLVTDESGRVISVCIPTAMDVHEGGEFEISCDLVKGAFILKWPTLTTEEKAMKITHLPLLSKESLHAVFHGAVDMRLLFAAAIFIANVDLVPFATATPRFNKSKAKGRARLFDAGPDIIIKSTGCDLTYSTRRAQKTDCRVRVEGRMATIDVFTTYVSLTMPNATQAKHLKSLIEGPPHGSKEEVDHLKTRIRELEELLARQSIAATTTSVALDRESEKKKGVKKEEGALGEQKSFDKSESTRLCKPELGLGHYDEKNNFNFEDDDENEWSGEVQELRARIEAVAAAVRYLKVKLRCSKFGSAANGNEELFAYHELLDALVEGVRQLTKDRSLHDDVKMQIGSSSLDVVHREVAEMDALVDQLKSSDSTVRRAAVTARSSLPYVRRLLDEELKKIEAVMEKCAK